MYNVCTCTCTCACACGMYRVYILHVLRTCTCVSVLCSSVDSVNSLTQRVMRFVMRRKRQLKMVAGKTHWRKSYPDVRPPHQLPPPPHPYLISPLPPPSLFPFLRGSQGSRMAVTVVFSCARYMDIRYCRNTCTLMYMYFSLHAVCPMAVQASCLSPFQYSIQSDTHAPNPECYASRTEVWTVAGMEILCIKSLNFSPFTPVFID